MKKLISTMLVTMLLLSSSIVAFAADNYTLNIVYEGNNYTIDNIGGTELDGTMRMDQLVHAISSGQIQGLVTPSNINNNLIINNGRVCSISNESLSSLNIKSGDTLYLYDSSEVVIARYQGTDYVISINEISVDAATLKTQIANELSLQADQITLTDSTGKSIVSGSVYAGAIVTVSSYPNDVITYTAEGYSTSYKDVSATYTVGYTSGEVYAVDITWGAMEFEYISATKYNPETHKEEATQESGWNYNGTNTIKVENHSNVDVKASFEFRADSEYYIAGANDGFTGSCENNTATSLTNNSIVLDSAVGKEVDAPATVNITFEVDGKLTGISSGNTVNIGTVTVTIDKVN